ncbi:Zn-ribbon domain-containing OB-fold protein [Gordonia paraffinivorans]|uniref:Zn-ribbon domain-containing OB-fold protein n=1 Tax=Gordonia paraffinivorans TaxID=175628 RepID=UPI001446359F|nr:OB-fold domain-containing protein [Gordonia paraffinivorans]
MTTSSDAITQVSGDPRPRISVAPNGSASVLGSRCGTCGHAVAYRWSRCPKCGGPLVPAEYAGTGVVWSTTTVHLAIGNHQPPYGLAYVDLDDGPRVLALIGGGEPSLRIGDRVTLSSTTDDNLQVDGVQR